MKKILLIEDNKDISKNIRRFLELHHFEVFSFFDGETGLEKALSDYYDLIILDITLPKINGFIICEKVLQQKTTPIIFITAKEGIEDKIFGLKLGAYDYLIKPFDLRELVIKIEKIVQLSPAKKTADVFQKGDISISLEEKKILKNDMPLHLPLKEFDILEILIHHQGKIVGRTEIIERIWGDNGLFESDQKLDTHISYIRKKLGKNFIETVKGVGYKI